MLQEGRGSNFGSGEVPRGGANCNMGQDATKNDPVLSQLMETIKKGIPDDKQQMQGDLSEYHQYRDHMSVVRGVVIYKDRLVILAALRGEVLKTLHSANQGVTCMHLRVGDSVFWPGMSAQLSAVREAYRACTQPSAPPTPLDPPEFHSKSNVWTLGDMEGLIIW